MLDLQENMYTKTNTNNFENVLITLRKCTTTTTTTTTTNITKGG